MLKVKPIIFITIPTLLVILFFSLPWQTRYIFSYGTIGEYPVEWLTRSVYGTELLGWLIVIGTIVVHRNRLCSLVRSVIHQCRNLWLGVISALSVAAACLFSSSFGLSVWYVARFVLVIGIIASVYFFSEKKVWFYRAFFASGVVQGIVAIIQFFTQQVWASKWLGMAEQLPSTLGTAVIENADGRWLRAYGSFGWPNALGIYVAFVLIIGFILLSQSRQTRHRLLIVAGEMIVATGLFLSFSRGAWVAAVAGVGLFFIVRCRQESWRSVVQNYAAVSGGILLVFIGFFVVNKPLLITRFTATNRLESRSLAERSSQYKEAFTLFRKHPWFGVGPGAYIVASHDRWFTVAPQPVHNIFVLLLVEWGAVPLVCAVSVIFKKAWPYRKKIVHILPFMAVGVVAGLFDHWLVSLYSGLVTSAAVIAFMLLELKEPREKREDSGGGGWR